VIMMKISRIIQKCLCHAVIKENAASVSSAAKMEIRECALAVIVALGTCKEARSCRCALALNVSEVVALSVFRR